MTKKTSSKSVQVSSPSPSATWGFVKITEDPGHRPLIYVNRPKKDTTSNVYTWWPDEVLKGEVPEGAVVMLRCETSHNGERRFSPVGTGNRSFDPFWPFYSYAFSCGHAILIKSKKMTKPQRLAYRASFFLFQRAQRMQQHIRRVFIRKKDLIVSKAGRRDKETNEEHVLPWPFSSTTQNAGYPQSVDALMELGAESAHKAGIPNPNSSQRIHYGLVAVARLDPKPLNPEVAKHVIKSVLFDVDPNCEPIATETFSVLEERVLTTIWPHLGDKTAVFNDWFWGRSNSFIKQVAKQKKSPGGELDPHVVEQYLLQKGWEAYEYVGHCVHAWACDMKKAMPDPLTDSEQNAFEALYFCRPEFGGIPLVLLAEKLQFVDTVLQEIVDHPSEDWPIQVFYRLLQFYSIMVDMRRKADVQIKETTTGKRKWFGTDAVPDLEDPSNSMDRVKDRDQLNIVIRRLAKIKKITCKCGKPNWEIKKTEEVETTHKFRLTFCCKKCHVTKTRVLSVQELGAAEC